MPKKHTAAINRGIYLLPNLFTTAGLFAAFYAIVSAMNGLYITASIAIFVAMLFDLFDGRVARMTQTETPFGAEYDSLSDMVSFGVAPALIVYSWSLHQFGKVGWLIAFLYTASVALRLARFNTQIGVLSKRYFQGMPSPAGAGVLAGFIWSCFEYDIDNLWVHLLAAGLTTLVAGLMVSNIRFASFKQINLRSRVRFITIVLIVLIFMAISVDPPLLFFTAFTGYAMSGPLTNLYRIRRAKQKRAVRYLH